MVKGIMEAKQYIEYEELFEVIKNTFSYIFYLITSYLLLKTLLSLSKDNQHKSFKYFF